MAIKISQMAEAPSLDGSELLEVSKLSSAITITAATISALASDNSYNDSGEGFILAAFSVGDQVNVTGFTGDTANNIHSGKIQSLTAGKMVIESPAGEAIVDDAAGESVTITKWDTYRTTTQNAANLGSSSSTAAVVTESGTTYDIDSADNGKYIRFTSTSAKTVTVRDESDHALPENGEWHLRNVGTNDLTLVEDTAVTINVPNGGTLVLEPGMTVTLKRVASDEFDLFGQTVPA